jgi:RND family efflux transporter MFP subunit
MTENDLARLHIDKSQFSRKSSWKRRCGWLLFLAMAIACTGYLYRRGLLTPAIEVQTASVQKIFPSQTFTVLNASGYVVAQRKAAVAAKITGRLIYLAVEEGSHVKRGEIIARLENDDTTAAKHEAEAALAAARHRLEQAVAELDDATLAYHRSQKLAAGGYIARSELDSATARFRRARAGVEVSQSDVANGKAALDAADVALGYSYIRAPFDAVVLTKNADIGDIVTPLGAAANAKAAVVNLADMRSLQVEVDVSESNIEKVHQGQPCEIYLDALPDERMSGRVHMIVPTADRTKASIMVKIAFKHLNPAILPEMSAKVAFLSHAVQENEKQPVTVVPDATVLRRDGRSWVYRITGNRAVAVPIHTGRRLNELDEILSGPAVGDKVVMSPGSRIRSGDVIKVAP